MRPVSLLLAAGLGTRFDPSGRTLKLLQPTAAGPHAGLPIVQAAARSLAAAGLRRRFAVVRPPAHPHQPELHALLLGEGCELLICEAAAEGMGSSLACGVRATSDADAWIVALGDMPMIAPATVEAIAAALRAGHATVAPSYRGDRGHPVGFAASCRPELMRLHGDRGARDLLVAHPPHLIEVDDPGILADIDHIGGSA
jgi:molybdenum cofactor cytidylyltransferase